MINETATESYNAADNSAVHQRIQAIASGVFDDWHADLDGYSLAFWHKCKSINTQVYTRVHIGTYTYI